MEIKKIVLRGGRKYVEYLKDGAKEVSKADFPEKLSRKEIEEKLKKPDAPAPKKS